MLPALRAERSTCVNKAHLRRNRLIAYAFLAPSLLGFSVFFLGPLIASFAISFTSWDFFGEITFVGFRNYIEMWQDETFQIAFRNSIYFVVVSVPVTLFLSLMVAMALNGKIRGMKAFRTAFFLPYIVATIAVAAVWQLLYHPTMGPINEFLRSLGISDPPRWLSSSDWAMTSVIIANIWHYIGYYMVIYLAGLQGIPKDLYEAADIDGANALRKWRNVTLPMLSPVIFFTVIIAIIHSFKVFEFVYALTGGGPGRSTNVLVYLIYVESFRDYEFGYASAMAYMLFMMIAVVTLIQFLYQKRWVTY